MSDQPTDDQMQLNDEEWQMRDEEGPDGQQAPGSEQLQGSNTAKDPDQWVTGDEPMTGAQKSYLETLAKEAGETLDPSLTKAQASKKIDELQQRTGRGR